MRSRPKDAGAPDVLWARISAAGVVLAAGGPGSLRCVKGGAGVYTLQYDPPFAVSPAVAVQTTGQNVADVNEAALLPESTQYTLAVPGAGPSDIEHFVHVTGSLRR